MAVPFEGDDVFLNVLKDVRRGRNMFAQTRVILLRLCTRNSSFAKGLLLVSVCRSLRRKRLDFLLLASLDCKKLRGLRALRMTVRFLL